MSKYNITCNNIGFIGNNNIIVNAKERSEIRVIRKMIESGKIDLEKLDMIADSLDNEELRDTNITIDKLKIIINNTSR